MIRTYNKGDRTQLSPNFKACEFDCKASDCSETLIDDKLVGRLQQIRDVLGKSIVITSGYRCPHHNAEVGGGTNSFHKKGMAADIVVADTTPLTVAQTAEGLGILGIGLYDSFVHVDTRDWKSFWYSSKQIPRDTFGGKPVEPPVSPVEPETEDKGIKRWGIDISRWQGDYDLTRAKSEGVEFVIVKGAGGDDGLYKDSQFESNYIKAKKLQMPIGCYFYSKALTKEDARKEAEYFYNTCLVGKRFDLPIYVDVEDKQMLSLGKQKLTEIVREFCSYLEERNIWVGVYSSLYNFKNYMDDANLQRYSIWVACWANSCNYGHERSFGMWQFGGETNTQRSKIVAGQTTDQNYMMIDYPTLIREKGKNGYGDMINPL